MYIHTYIHAYNQINSVGSPAGYAIDAMGISSTAVSMPLFPSATATILSPDIIRINILCKFIQQTFIHKEYRLYIHMYMHTYIYNAYHR